jgi:hypothetical protein
VALNAFREHGATERARGVLARYVRDNRRTESPLSRILLHAISAAGLDEDHQPINWRPLGEDFVASWLGATHTALSNGSSASPAGARHDREGRNRHLIARRRE